MHMYATQSLICEKNNPTQNHLLQIDEWSLRSAAVT